MMWVALLLIVLLFGGLVVSVVTLALGVATELVAYTFRFVVFVLRRSVGPLRRRTTGGTRRLATPGRTRGSAPRRPLWWDGPRARSGADVGNLMRGIEAAHTTRRRLWDRD